MSLFDAKTHDRTIEYRGGAMSNQDRLLSDEELRREVVQKIAHMVAEGIKGGAFMDWTVGNEIADLFDTQKRLYAESVIGEDESAPKRDQVSKHRHGKLFYTYAKGVSPSKIKGRNELRAEQRARIK